MKAAKKRIGIIRQVAILFALGVIIIGFMTFMTQHSVADDRVMSQMKTLCAMTSEETAKAVREYPAYRWLVSYWYEHSDELDIEYDVGFTHGTKTEEKCARLSKHAPDLQLKYASEEDISKLSPADQKLYAEIAYSWLITRVDQIKQSYGADYLFCVLTDETFKNQFFLFSGADPNAVRGTNYEEVYTLGVRTDVGESQTAAMQRAKENTYSLADAGDYVDYYYCLDTIGDYTILVGITNSLADMREAVRSDTVASTATSVAFLAILSLICLGMITLFVLRPLKKIQANIRLYKQNKDSSAVRENLASVRPDNEIGELSEDIVSLTEEIDHHIEEIGLITAEKQKISTELDMAKRIQEAMLPGIFPAFPERSDFDIYATMEPAKQVGGDFYDFFLIDEDHLYLAIADVSGKSVPAALFMMMSKIILQNCALIGLSPAEILARTNGAVCANNGLEMFVTVWAGILEISTGKLIAANAGHEFPAIMRAGKKFELLKDRHGFVIGGMKGMKYTEYEIQLQPGDKLFVYTDGIPEAMDADKKMYGTARMVNALNDAKDASPQTILQTVRESIRVFVRDCEQFDDMTMLCLEYNGRKQATESF